MTMKLIERLEARIKSMEELIKSQEEKQNVACECLNQVKTSKAVSNIIKKVQGTVTSQSEITMYNNAILEAYENVNSVILATSAMKQELKEWEKEVAILKSNSNT